MKKFLAVAMVLVLALGFTGCGKKNEDQVVEKEKPTVEVKEEEVVVEEEAEKTVNYVLYLKYKNEPFLVDYMYEVSSKDNDLEEMGVERYSLERLFDFPGDDMMVTPVPEGVKVLGLTIENMTAKVDISSNIFDSKLSKEEGKILLSSIVNTLVIHETIDNVEIYVDGNKLDEFFGNSVSAPVEFIGDVFPEK
ncbi:MAG: GerMN domain-containing protein [Firmicutes bacterium]|jgi:spore germination protein GerM|nr:GerMN domain-containing protein [Bacillota bacterium]